MKRIVCLAVGLLLSAQDSAPAAARQTLQGINDTTRFLAGLPASKESYLKELERTPEWQSYAAAFNKVWQRAETKRFSQIRLWQATSMPGKKMEGRPLYYPFSGPDLIYARLFFPAATEYLMCGLEPVGAMPDGSLLNRSNLGPTLAHLQKSMDTVLNFSYFITKDMKVDLRTSLFQGTLPLILIFAVREGCSIEEISFLQLARDGTEREVTWSEVEKSTPNGVRIRFLPPQGQLKTVRYFTTDVSNGGKSIPPFAKLMKRLGPGSGYLKAASYLLHYNNFSQMRETMLEQCDVILQDDSGIPFKAYDPAVWNIRCLGGYAGTLEMFKEHYQQDMGERFAQGAEPIPFGLGYMFKQGETALLLAEKQQRFP